MSDVAKLLNDLDVVVSILCSEIDSVKLKIRLEEAIDRYDVNLKTEESRKDDLIANIKLYISAKRLEVLSELTLQDYYRELMMFEFYVQKYTVAITTSDIRMFLARDEGVSASTTGKKLSVIKTFLPG